jgi:hypothetical protein
MFIAAQTDMYVFFKDDLALDCDEVAYFEG